MAKRPIDLVRVIQNLIANDFSENIGYDPLSPGRFFTDNFVQRTLAHLVGLSSTGALRLRCNSAGELVVATTGAAYEDNDTKIGDAPNAYAGAIEFDSISSRIDIFVYDNAAFFKRTPDGTRWNDEIEIPAGSMYSIDVATHSFDIRNQTADDVARYSVVGWY